jgi:signal recognition particle subunit SRP54
LLPAANFSAGQRTFVAARRARAALPATAHHRRRAPSGAIMVLEALGSKITGALRKLTNSTIIDEETLAACLKEISHALLEADVNIRAVVELRKNVTNRVNMEELAAGVNKRKLIQKAVFDELCAMLDPGTVPAPLKRGKPNIVMFVGLQGNGKTTSCVKYAHYHRRKNWKTCLVCADTFRAGAFDQLKQNATKAKIPFYGSYTETDPVKIAMDGVERFKKEGYELIIVDTSGRHKQEASLFAEMTQMQEVLDPQNIVFVMDSSIGQAAHDQALAFKQQVRIGSVIITKLDGHAKGGGALSAVSATESPITFIGTGEHIDELEEFNTASFVGRLLGLGDVSGLVNSIKSAGLADNPELYKRLTEGIFTLRDMRDQFENIAKMGPISKVMGMIPGMSEMASATAGQDGGIRIKRFGYMMDSMTDDELDNPKLKFSAERIQRIARGSGRHPQEVEELLVEYKRFSKVVGKVGKMSKKNMNMDQMSRGTAASLQEHLDPRMLSQFGGAQGFSKIVRRTRWTARRKSVALRTLQATNRDVVRPLSAHSARNEQMQDLAKQMGPGGLPGMGGLG